MSDGLGRLGEALSDRYRIERELGAGGMATVYLADDLKHRRKVALKVLRPELAASLGPERFLREVTIAANLQHPHILGLHDSGIAGGFLYYVMPYVDGPTLRQKISLEGELPIGDAVRILRDLADALAHAHKHGVIHRDIKPENVLISERHALVTDFGVAKAVSAATGEQSVTTVGVVLGTPAYMAPEQAAADPTADHRADIYAFGVVAYELLTGQPPFTGATPQAILAAQVTKTAEPVATRRTTIPAPLSALVMQCLQKKPADRPQTAEELVARLEAAMTSSSGSAPVTPGTRPGGLVLLGSSVVVAAAIGFAIWKQASAPSAVATAVEVKSIAVLPLVNVGGDSTQDYYADGVSEELANALGKVRGLQVAARTSSFAFKGRRDLDVKEVAEKLQVGVVLQGTVRRLGDRLRLSVQLTDALRGVELWSESYDQASTEVFAIQDSITRAIVRQLALTLGAAGRSGRTPIPAAHDLYLRGLALANRATEQDIREGLANFRRALDLDPDYVDAWLGTAYAYVALADVWQASRAAYDSSAMAAREALARDSLAGEAHTYIGLGYVVPFSGEAESHFRRAISTSPNSAFAHAQYGVLLCGIGRVDEGLTLVDRARELDRLSFQVGIYQEYCLYSAHRYADVIAAHDRNNALGPEQIYLDDLKAAATRELGDYDEALSLYEHAQTLSPQPLFGYAITHARIGKTKEARDILARLVAYARGHYVNPVTIAMVHANLGENDLAFEWLERAVTDGTVLMSALKSWPELDPIRSDPRYGALVKRLRL